jgi:hypothetical protein
MRAVYMEQLSHLVLLKHTNALLVVYFEYFLVRKSTIDLMSIVSKQQSTDYLKVHLTFPSSFTTLHHLINSPHYYYINNSKIIKKTLKEFNQTAMRYLLLTIFV